MKSYTHLTSYDRYTIFLGVSLNKSISEIAKCTGVHRSTIYREIERNRNRLEFYDHRYASNVACNRRKKCRRAYTKIKGEVLEEIKEGLEKRWSPEQIVGRVRMRGDPFVCVETIYRFLYSDRQESGELWKKLRVFRRIRRRKRFEGSDGRGIGWKHKRVRIAERPKIANQRDRLGDLERDLIVGKRIEGSKSCLLTIVDRRSRKLWMRKVKNTAPKNVHKATIKILKKVKVHTITNDNGLEFRDFKQTEKSLKTRVYFSTPYVSYERGSIENMNGLIREYFPKKTNFEEVTDEEVQVAQEEINGRPRKTLGYLSPNEFSRKEKIN